MATPKKKRTITAKEVAVLLKVSPEVVTYLRQYEKLPFSKNSKYIVFSEPEVIRWRNRKLTEESKIILNLKVYYQKTNLQKFITYEAFKEKVEEIAFLDNDNVLQYIKRQNPEKDIIDLVGDIVHQYWDAKLPHCIQCGRKLHSSSVDTLLCFTCKTKLENEKHVKY